MMKYISLALILHILAAQIPAQQHHQNLQLDQSYHFELDHTAAYAARFTFAIPDSAVRKVSAERWFFFLEVEANQQSEWISPFVTISVRKTNSNELQLSKRCSTHVAFDTCFFTNDQFNYQTQHIHATVQCKSHCQFKISAEISSPYKLNPGTTLQLDFQRNAYSKLFTLSTHNQPAFDQLRIILQPKGFLQPEAPFGLYVNKAPTTPSRYNTFKSITLWNSGQGVFIDSPQPQANYIILVQSPQKNILLLKTQMLLFNHSTDLAQMAPYFDYLQQSHFRYYRTKVNSKKGICVKLTTFSGKVQFGGFYDDKKQLIVNEFHQMNRSYGEIQYQLSPQFFQANEGSYEISSYILFEIAAKNMVDSTFLVQTYELEKNILHLIPQVQRFVDLPPQAANQYYLQLVEEVRPEFKKAQIEIFLQHKDQKPLRARFFKCHQYRPQSCRIDINLLNEQQNQTYTQINTYIQQRLVNDLTIYKFSIANKLFDKVSNNSDIKRYLMVIVIENLYNQSQDYKIRYSNPNRNIYLRQQSTQRDTLSNGQRKHYLFTNTNPDVKNINVHLALISGSVRIQGFRSDPRIGNPERSEQPDYFQILKFSNVKLNQTIFVRASGNEASYYSIQLQLIKQSQLNMSDRTGKSGGFNQILLAYNIRYQFVLSPYETAVYQFRTEDPLFYIIFSSLLNIDVCFSQDMTQPPFAPFCSDKLEFVKWHTISFIFQKGNIVNIGILNNNTKNNTFGIQVKKYKNWPMPQPDNSCHFGHRGMHPKLQIKKQVENCYSFYLQKIDALELTFDISPRQQDQVKIIAVFKQKDFNINPPLHVLKWDEVKQACALFPCIIKLYIEALIDVSITYSVQQLSKPASLLDGVAHTFYGEWKRRKFIYFIPNKINTTIVLQNKGGYCRFYGYIKQHHIYNEDELQFLGDVFPSSTKYHFKSTNPFYYSHQIAIVTEKQIKDANCTRCVFLLVVQQEKQPSQNQTANFTLQCTQEDRLLIENQPAINHLNKNAFAFYQIYNQKQGTLIASVNSQNQQCARIYIKKGQTRASEFQYDATPSLNTVTIENAQKGSYAITLEAIQDCHYSIQYSTFESKIYSVLQRGLLTDVRFSSQVQSLNLLYHHTKNQSFKILSLLQQGKFEINVRTYKDIKNFVNEDIKQTKLSTSGINVVRIEKDASFFCLNCFYLIEIKNQKSAKASVIIPTQGQGFPIMVGSNIQNELRKGQYEILRVSKQQLIQFQIVLLYGTVNVSIRSNEKDSQLLFEKTYSKSEKTKYYQSITITNSSKQKEIHHFGQVAKIIIRAQENTGFYFTLLSDKSSQNTVGVNRVIQGIPIHMQIQENKKECVFGRLDDPQEQFFISTLAENSQSLMSNLQVSCKTNGQQSLELNTTISKSEMVIKLQNPPKNHPNQYELCLKSPDNFDLVFIQSDNLLYLPANTPIAVQKLINFSFYSWGRSILEINECKTRAVTSIHSSYSPTQNLHSEIKQLRKSNNIIEFDYTGVAYVQVDSQSANIAWRSKDQTQRIGFGYDEYSASRIRYSKEGDKLKVVIYGLTRKDSLANPMVELGQSNYTAILADDEMNLYNAINCGKGNYLESQSKSSKNPHHAVTLHFEITPILQKFKGKWNILIGAFVVARPQHSHDGKYRFIYPYLRTNLGFLNANSNGDQLANEEPTTEWEALEQPPWGTPLYLLLALCIVAIAAIIYQRLLKKCTQAAPKLFPHPKPIAQLNYQEFQNCP